MQQFLILIGNHRTNHITSVPYTSCMQTGYSIYKLCFKLRIVIHLFFKEQQRTSRTFLSGIAECRGNNVLNSMLWELDLHCLPFQD